jgi:hypothetical protein
MDVVKGPDLKPFLLALHPKRLLLEASAKPCQSRLLSKNQIEPALTLNLIIKSVPETWVVLPKVASAGVSDDIGYSQLRACTFVKKRSRCAA